MNFSYLFSANCTPALAHFNEPLDSWDTSNVTDMSFMFYDASAFNQSVSHFVVSKVTTMAAMFKNASSFDQELTGWKTINLSNMSGMFRFASKFNQKCLIWTFLMLKLCKAHLGIHCGSTKIYWDGIHRP